MKKITINALLLVIAALGLTTPVRGQTITQSTNFSASAAIPDNNASGLASTRTFSSSIINVTDLNVTLNVSGNFNGDLYGYLTHGSGFSVLLNRPGRTAANPFGYADSGLNLNFDDSAANGDVHNYRLTLSGNQNTALAGPLTGVWGVDGRNVDPANALDTDSRTALLSAFNGLDPNGSWTLFLADLSAGGTSSLNNWGLEVTGLPIPEPSQLALLGLGAIGLWCGRRWRHPGR